MAMVEYNESVILASLNAFWIDPTDGTLKNIPSLTDIGEIGEESEKKEKTNLSDQIKKYADGMQDAPDKSLIGQDIPYQAQTSNYYQDYVDQQAFYKIMREKREVHIVIKFEDGKDVSFLFKPLGFKFQSPNQAEWRMFEIPGSQNTRTLWGVDITGSDTVAANSTIDLAAATDPTDLTLETGETFTWSSSNDNIATVDSSGVVSGVAAGEVDIMAEIRGVVGHHTVTVTA